MSGGLVGRSRVGFAGPAAIACVVVGCAFVQAAAPGKPGGWSAANVVSKEVLDAAKFAVEAQAKVARPEKDSPPVKLELVKVERAEQQVVAGMNYRLRLRVKENGAEKLADAVVWWQAWRKPNPFELTSWKWDGK